MGRVSKYTRQQKLDAVLVVLSKRKQSARCVGAGCVETGSHAGRMPRYPAWPSLSGPSRLDGKN